MRTVVDEFIAQCAVDDIREICRKYNVVLLSGDPNSGLMLLPSTFVSESDECRITNTAVFDINNNCIAVEGIGTPIDVISDRDYQWNQENKPDDVFN